MIILINGSISCECIRPITNRSGTLHTASSADHIKIREEMIYSKTILKCFNPSRPSEKNIFNCFSLCDQY